MIMAKDADGHKVTGMNFIDTMDFVNDENIFYCTMCFDDKRYDHVQRILQRNYNMLYVDSVAYDY